MRVRVTERRVNTVQGPKKAWVAEPTEHMVVGRERLERFRTEGYPGGEVDRELLAAVRAVEDSHQLVVFRAASDDGEGSWGFDPSLDDHEARELGYHLVTDQLPTYRRLVAAGVFAIVHVEFSARAVDALQTGTRRLLGELDDASIPDEMTPEDALALLQVDRWILDHLCFFFTLGFEEIVDSVLKQQLPWLEDRISYLRHLAASLPEAVID